MIVVIFARILKASRCAASSLFADATLAIKRLPTMRDAMEAIGLFMLFLLAAGLVNKTTGLVTFPVLVDWAALSPVLLLIVVTAFFVPALSEELAFRVGLSGLSGRWRGGLALAAFVIWHPVQVWLGLPMAQPVFLDPAFLMITALLGLICTISYRRSQSIWPPVFIHWLVVVGWKILGG